MGEKGNTASAAALVAGGSDSLFERVVSTTTETVTGVGEDFVGVLRDKSIGAVADNTVAAARERLHRKADGDEDAQPQRAPDPEPDEPGGTSAAGRAPGDPSV
jgi:hypothetical protein